ncbi:MAG: PQQ-binding-like beta-propeller repeat protein [Deltaproteobacteria bacterium]|nr:PQQ-binding-like beta-propeller repeat protein [Deltaproteobacteria bacterium]
MKPLSLALSISLLTACGSADMPPTESAPAARPGPSPTAAAATSEQPVAREVYSLDAVDAVLRGRLLIVVDPGSRLVRALDVESGEEAWRVELGEEAPASILQDLGGGRLMVQVPGQEFHTLDIERGVRIAHRPSPRDRRFVAHRGGACALHRNCVLEPISCEDGHALGPALRGARIHFFPTEDWENGGTTCASRLDELGRAGELSLYVMRVEGQEHAEVIARDDAGTTRWRSSDVACEQCQTVGMGSAPDGSVCWTTDAVEQRQTLRAFRCADGEPLFERQLRGAPGYRLPQILTGWVREPPGLYVASEGQAMLLAPDGTPRWTRGVDGDRLVLPDGLRVPSFPLALERYSGVEWVDASTGHTRETRTLYSGAELRIDQAGQVQITPPGQTSDRAGAPVPAPMAFRLRRARSGSRVSLAGRTVLDLEHDAHVVGERTTDAGSWLVVAEQRAGQPDRLHVLATGPARCEGSCCPPQQRTPSADGTLECCLCDPVAPP